MPKPPSTRRRRHARAKARTTTRATARAAIRTKANSDRHELYEESVQSPEVELAFVDRVYRRLRGVLPTRLREDFCGTAWNSCEWVKRREKNTAVGLDLHAPTLAWGTKNHLSKLTPQERRRVRLVRRNVLTPGDATGVDVVLALNFSWWVFQERAVLLEYFRNVRRSLRGRGLFVLDLMGGWESMKTQDERRRQRGFTYIWRQARFNPIRNHIECHIDFDFKRGPRWARAFVYDWRLWTLPETRDVLEDAGFSGSRVFWEGDDEHGRGNGVFREQTVGEDCASFVAYIVAEK